MPGMQLIGPCGAGTSAGCKKFLAPGDQGVVAFGLRVCDPADQYDNGAVTFHRDCLPPGGEPAFLTGYLAEVAERMERVA